jgi:hypothetical protein
MAMVRELHKQGRLNLWSFVITIIITVVFNNNKSSNYNNSVLLNLIEELFIKTFPLTKLNN